MSPTLTIYQPTQDALNQKLYSVAENLLNTLEQKDAHWDYLYSFILIEKAWFDSALSHLEEALHLAPTNVVYQEAKAKLMGRYNPYRDPYYNTSHYHRRSGCCCCCCDDCCHVSCCDLICLDTCCECMGGDLISCI